MTKIEVIENLPPLELSVFNKHKLKKIIVPTIHNFRNDLYN